MRASIRSSSLSFLLYLTLFSGGCVTTASFLLVVGGCATGDPVIVASQKATTTSFYSLDLFVHLEHDNRALADSISPEIHKVANQVRLHGPQAPRPEDNYIEVVRNLTAAYQANKNDATKTALEKAIADLNGLLAAVQHYLPLLQAKVSTSAP
jgi:UTP:GlnB (protein PII) uridylyltransferase